MQSLLGGFTGYLLSDAATVYDILHRDGAMEVGCWFDLRRHFWRGLEVGPQRAIEVLALIAGLFGIERDCRGPSPIEHTAQRAERSRPLLALIDAWLARNKGAVDPRGPLHQGIGYYENERAALRRFLDDGGLRLDNSISERQLRNPARQAQLDVLCQRDRAEVVHRLSLAHRVVSVTRHPGPPVPRASAAPRAALAHIAHPRAGAQVLARHCRRARR
jgi:hypothetical protein